MRIVQPKNTSAGSLNLQWNPLFSATHQSRLQSAQNFVDSECIRNMKPYTPFQNGVLERSAILGTTIGSGEIHQIAPYARYLYYGLLMVSSITGSAFARNGEKKVLTNTPLKYHNKHPESGKMWFERMKADKKSVILRGACKLAGGMPR